MNARRSPEDGSTLILAVTFILATAMIVTALLSFVFAGTGAGVSARDQGLDAYAADGAIEAVISDLRLNKDLGVAGEATSCGPFTKVVNGRNVTVECVPLGTSRQTYTVGGGAPAGGLPEGAIVALGPEGVDFQNNAGGKTLTIGGDIVSRGPVAAGGSNPVAVNGSVFAPSCSGNLYDANTGLLAECRSKTPTDPGWGLPRADAPPPRTLPAGAYCNTGTAVLPGTYTSATAWTAMVRDCGTGAVAGTLRFEGVYFLDFADTAPGCGPKRWCIDNSNATLTAGSVDATGACTSDGAVFVLGGETTIDVQAGSLRMCGFRVPGGPTISLYAKSPPDAEVVGPAPATVTLKPSTAKSTGSPSYANQNNARDTETTAAGPFQAGSVAKATHEQKGSPATQTASIRLSDFTPLPPGATVQKVIARVAHRESTSAGVTGAQVRLSVVGMSGHYSSTGSSCQLCWSTSGASHEVDITSALPTAAAVASAQLDFAAVGTFAKDATLSSELDGIELLVTYLPASVPPPPPWGTLVCSSPPCTVLRTDGNQTDAGFFGTIYAPTSRVFLKPVNQATAAASRGIVVRTLSVHVPTLVDATSFHISLPSGAAGPTRTRDGLVTLRALIDGRERLTTTVTLPDGLIPTGATVADWTVR